MWRRLLLGCLVIGSLCAWPQTQQQSSGDSKAPDAASQTDSQTNSQPQDNQDQPEDKNKEKEGWFHKRFGQGCVAGMACWGHDQDKNDGESPQSSAPPANQAPPRSTIPRGPGDSSSRDTSSGPAADNNPDNSDVTELHSWDPHKAAKDIEVGDFNFRQQRYGPAISRYCEALQYKPGDATATFRVAQSLEKAGDLAGAQTYYEAYLKILPTGPFAAQSKKALEHLKALPERPSKHMAEREGCEPPGRPVRARREPVDPDRPVLTRNPTSQPEGKNR